MTPYQRAVEVATKAHAGQTRKNGEPYINHCLRVAEAVPEHLKVAAVLHDTVEDTGLTISDIAEEFWNDVASDVSFLTRKDGYPYLEYILDIKESDDATTIKLADIADNLNGATGTLKDKYELARWILEEGR